MSDFYCDEILTQKLKVSVVFESDLVMAFHHTKPFFEKHVVIIPKAHLDSVTSSGAADANLASEFMLAIRHVASIFEKEYGGCRVSSNVGSYQSSKHLHWYVHFGKRLRDEDGYIIET